MAISVPWVNLKSLPFMVVLALGKNQKHGDTLYSFYHIHYIFWPKFVYLCQFTYVYMCIYIYTSCQKYICIHFRKRKTYWNILILNLCRHHEINTDYFWFLQLEEVFKLVAISFQIFIIMINCYLCKLGHWVLIHASSISSLRVVSVVSFLWTTTFSMVPHRKIIPSVEKISYFYFPEVCIHFLVELNVDTLSYF